MAFENKIDERQKYNDAFVSILTIVLVSPIITFAIVTMAWVIGINYIAFFGWIFAFAEYILCWIIITLIIMAIFYDKPDDSTF